MCPSSASSHTQGGETDGGKHEGARDAPQNHAWGVFYTPQEHFEAAKELEHPATTTSSIPDVLRKNIFELATLGSQEIARRRKTALNQIVDMAEQIPLQPEAEYEMSHVFDITKLKHLPLFRKLLEETQFPDMDVCRALEEGVALVGSEPESSLFTKRYKPFLLTPQQLDSQAMLRRRSMLEKPPAAIPPSQLQVLLNETAEEVSLGFLEGPLSEEQVTSKLGTPNWSPSQRFLLLQGEDQKPRVIDNLRDSGVNAAFASSSYLTMFDCDWTTALAVFIARVWSNTSEVVVPMTDGSTLRGLWHRSMVGQVPWLGRCFDLSKAYKQVPVAEDSLKYGVLAMPDENNAWSFYISRSLPFGAGASVFAFNKLSRALWHIMVHKFGLILGVFVDDFPAMEVEDLAPMTTQIVSTFFSVLGWKHVTEGEKAVEFAPSWVALGVRFDFTLLSSGRLIVANKEGRLTRIVHLAERLESQEPCSTAVASTLHGLLNFAGGYVLGHSLKPAARAVSAILFRKAAPSQGRLREIIALVKCVTERAQPRVIEVNDQSRPLIIYTDGGFENGTGRWAAVVFDPRSRDRGVVHGVVPQRLIDHWKRVVGKQVICEVEMYAYLMARLAWIKICANRGGIVFIDNDATLACLIRATSKSDAMFRIVTVLSVLDTCSAFGPWFERVPSPANPADWPTRDRIGDLKEVFGCTEQRSVRMPEEVESFLLKPGITAPDVIHLASALSEVVQAGGSEVDGG